jgi:predicted nucleotidyltransferase
MRLTQAQIEAIKQAAEQTFGSAANVWLFGSRVDDARRGGDVDLYVELPHMKAEERQRLETSFWIRLQRALGEQKIDIVTHQEGAPMRLIDQQARSTRVQV